MSSLHITNITGSPLSFACSSSDSIWTHIDHDSNARVYNSPSTKGWKRTKSYLHVRPSGHRTNEKVPPIDNRPPSWTFSFTRVGLLAGKQPWCAVDPVCQHTPSRYPRRTACLDCRRELPWRVYVLYTKDESRVLVLRSRDLSSFLSETEGERLLSDVVLPGAPIGYYAQICFNSIQWTGTHDSLAFYGWPVSQCQSPDQPLLTQLMSGIRALDVRLAVIDGVLMAYHGAAPQRTYFAAILHTLGHFLRLRPRECIVASLKQEDFASTNPRVFSRLVREEIERSEGGMGLWWLENRVPRLEEVRGRCIMFSRFGGDGKEWEGGLERMGIHPTEWPDSKQEGFEWDLKGITVRTHDWYMIPNLLAVPEKTALCVGNLVIPSGPPTLGITFLSASGGALALPPFCALGVGWPSWGLGVEGVNARVGRWLIGRLTTGKDELNDHEKARWSIASHQSGAELLHGCNTEDKLPVRGWVFMDYFAEPDGGLVPLLVENNFIPRP